MLLRRLLASNAFMQTTKNQKVKASKHFLDKGLGVIQSKFSAEVWDAGVSDNQPRTVKGWKVKNFIHWIRVFLNEQTIDSSNLTVVLIFFRFFSWSQSACFICLFEVLVFHWVVFQYQEGPIFLFSLNLPKSASMKIVF